MADTDNTRAALSEETFRSRLQELDKAVVAAQQAIQLEKDAVSRANNKYGEIIETAERKAVRIVMDAEERASNIRDALRKELAAIIEEAKLPQASGEPQTFTKLAQFLAGKAGA